MDLRRAARDPWVWGQLALFLVIGLAAPLLPRHASLGELDPVLTRLDPLPIRRLGWPLILAGIGIAAWGARSLGRSLTPGTEPLPNAPLVTTGAYGYVRHPIYTGAVLLLAGYTLLWSNWILALVFGLIAWLYFDRKARAEERWLLGRHALYESYMRRVPRRVL
jgi:protein-S-isoprenylcysteine O-methyltransferase Ste14